MEEHKPILNSFGITQCPFMSLTLFPPTSYQLHSLSSDIFGATSKSSPLEISEELKSKLGIPAHAISFMWGYPMFNVNGQSRSQSDVGVTPEIQFAHNGGFVYLDEDLNVACIHAVTEGNSFQYDEPLVLTDTDIIDTISKQKLWQKPTKTLIELGIEKYCWFPLSMSHSSLKSKKHLLSPHGTLIFTRSGGTFYSRIKENDKEDSIVFFAIGDWGYPTTKLMEVAQSMQTYSQKIQKKPKLILALGDNFYPDGVDSVNDPQFKTSWEGIFLIFPNLCVPWFAVLGNHDYIGNPEAQIQFTNSEKNPGGLWRMPDRNYTFSEVLPANRKSEEKPATGKSEVFPATKKSKVLPATGKSEVLPKKVDFFALDTNGAQGHVRRRFPNIEKDLFHHKEWLRNELEESKAEWKIVFGHHAMYTRGRNHGTVGRCLRDDVYSHGSGTSKGYGFEQVLIDGKVNVYISGHEHLLQHHHAKGVEHFVVGASGGESIGFYGGEDKTLKPTWWDKTSSKSGFLAIEVSDNWMKGSFIDSECNVLYSVNITRDST